MLDIIFGQNKSFFYGVNCLYCFNKRTAEFTLTAVLMLSFFFQHLEM